MTTDPRESLILEVLAAGEKPGREIRDECQLLTGRVWPLGSLYVLLEGLKDRGILSARDGDPSPERGGSRRRYYRLNAPAEPRPSLIESIDALRAAGGDGWDRYPDPEKHLREVTGD